MAHSARAIANAFILKGLAEKNPLTLMQLTKLVYFAHGWHLAMTGKPFISEPIEAWKFGPVIPTIYYSAKEYGALPVTDLLKDCGIPLISRFNDQEQEIIDAVYRKFGNTSGIQLSQITHESNSPWDTVWNHQGGSSRQGAVIDNSVIRDYYLRAAQSRRTA